MGTPIEYRHDIKENYIFSCTLLYQIVKWSQCESNTTQNLGGTEEGEVGLWRGEGDEGGECWSEGD